MALGALPMAGALPARAAELPGPPAGALVTTAQVRAELVAQAPEGVVAGQPMWLGLLIRHQPGWHTYWKNPGDSGLPTTLQWTLPRGFAAGAIEWPTPQRLPVGPLLNYGYEGTLLLPVPVTVPAGFQGAALPVKLHAEWLVCKDVCIPQSGDFALSVPAQAATAGQAALFEQARRALPRPLPGVQARAGFEDGRLVLHVAGLPAAWQGRSLQLFPETPGLIDNAAAVAAGWEAGTWTARIALDAQRTAAPTALPLVLVAAGEPAGAEVQAAVTAPW
ncbi:MAG: protein-disulfide reductase, partial [Burkholderiales bacterium]|nr:protein-disulfide reductase [Burkholderiales bacterium]